VVVSLEAENRFWKVLTGDAKNLNPVSGPGPCTLRGLIHPNGEHLSGCLLRCGFSHIKSRLKRAGFYTRGGYGAGFSWLLIPREKLGF